MKKNIRLALYTLGIVLAGSFGLLSGHIEGRLTAGPNDPLEPQLQALGFNTREEFLAFYGISGVRADELHGCASEPNACIAISNEKDAEEHIIPFWMQNPTSCTLDGWPTGAKTPGIKPKFKGQVEGATFRPCRTGQRK
jgi:hypothetical protein